MSDVQALIGFGQVRHTRLRPARNAFAYPTYFLMLPLRSLHRDGSGALAHNRRAALSFFDSDHGDGRANAVQWLDELKQPQALRDYASADEVAARLLKNNPLLAPDKAAWLAPHWAQPGADGRWRILGDPAHRRVNPALYQADEVTEAWKLITAPLLWAEGDRTDVAKWWGDRYPRAEFEARLAVVPQVERTLLSPCGHMLHHDQPEALAAAMRRHLA